MHCRYNLTQASNICKAAPRSLFWSPSGLNELLKEGFELLFNLIAKSTMAFLTGQPQHVLKSCLGHQNKGLVLAHRLTLPDIQFHLWCKLPRPYLHFPTMDGKPCSLYKYFTLLFKHPIIILQTIHFYIGVHLLVLTVAISLGDFVV